MGDTYAHYFKFTVVRNPWDWVVSNYAYNRGLHRCYVIGTRYEVEGRTPGRIPGWAKDMAFDEWLPWWLDTFNPSQLALFTDDAGKLLVDEVYRFENLEQALKTLCRRLKVDFALRPFDTRSTQRHADYREHYAPETRERVARHFEREIELFKYSFGTSKK
jgi:hypothetical protein